MRPCSQRPLANGTSGTLEILLGMTLVGVSALTAAVLIRRGAKDPPPPSEKRDEGEPEE